MRSGRPSKTTLLLNNRGRKKPRGHGRQGREAMQMEICLNLIDTAKIFTKAARDIDLDLQDVG